MKSKQEQSSILGSALDRRLIRALRRSFDLAKLYPSSPISLELFLCALFDLYPRKMLKLWKDKETFDLLLARYAVGTPDESHPGQFRASTTSLWQGPVACDLDEALSRTLVDAVQFTIASGGKRAGIREFVGILSLDQKLIQKLSQDLGLFLRNGIRE